MIQSHNNSKIKLVKSLYKKKYRDLHNMFIVEGERFVRDIPNHVDVETILVSKTFSEKKDISNISKCEIVDDKIFKEISDTKNSQGILGICYKQKHDDNLEVNEDTFIVIGDRLQDPGNVGTLIRTAVSAGVTHIVLSEGSVDIYNSKVIRATASSIFNINIIENVDLIKFLEKIKNENVDILGTHLDAQDNYFDINMKKSLAVVVGNEGNGISDEVKEICTKLIKIPMIGDIESLNASISSAIIMYEVVRQRF